MTFSESPPIPAPPGAPPSAGCRAPDPQRTVTAVAVYGCGPAETALLREIGPRLGVAPVVTAAPVSEANADLAAGHRCVSVGHKNRITNATLRALGRGGVRYLSTRSIGFDHLDVRYADSVGIRVENVAYSPDSVADYTLMLMLMAIRDARDVLRRADEHDYRLPARRGRELRELTVGVIGTGRIGSAVLDRLRGFGASVLAHDSRPGAAAEYVPLDDLLAHSDLVTLHTPLDASTHHLLDRRRLGLLPRGACVVNTGRGPLVDTEALVQALESGALGGAALDVLEGEEGVFYAAHGDRPVDHPLLARLRELPNVIVSPHSAYYTDRALRDAVENSLRNCRNFESGNHRG